MAVARGRSPSQFRYPGREADVSIIAPQRSNSAHLRRPRRAIFPLSYNAICALEPKLQFCLIQASKQSGEIVVESRWLRN